MGLGLELERGDWEKIRDEARTFVHNAMVNVEVFTATMKNAEKQLKKFPEPKKKDTTVIN